MQRDVGHVVGGQLPRLTDDLVAFFGVDGRHRFLDQLVYFGIAVVAAIDAAPALFDVLAGFHRVNHVEGDQRAFAAGIGPAGLAQMRVVSRLVAGADIGEENIARHQIGHDFDADLLEVGRAGRGDGAVVDVTVV